MTNLETVRLDRCFQFVLSRFADVRVQFALTNRIDKRMHFALLPSDLHLDAAINQVAHPTDNIEALRDAPDGPAKADALNTSFVKYLERGHRIPHEARLMIPAARSQRQSSSQHFNIQRRFICKNKRNKRCSLRLQPTPPRRSTGRCSSAKSPRPPSRLHCRLPSKPAFPFRRKH